MEIGPPSIGIPILNGPVQASGMAYCPAAYQYVSSNHFIGFQIQCRDIAPCWLFTGRPNGERNGLSVTPYGTPYWAGCRIPYPCLWHLSAVPSGSRTAWDQFRNKRQCHWVGNRTSRFGSTEIPPHSNIPRLPGRPVYPVQMAA